MQSSQANNGSMNNDNQMTAQHEQFYINNNKTQPPLANFNQNELVQQQQKQTIRVQPQQKLVANNNNINSSQQLDQLKIKQQQQQQQQQQLLSNLQQFLSNNNNGELIAQLLNQLQQQQQQQIGSQQSNDIVLSLISNLISTTNAQHQNLPEPIKPPTPSSFNNNNDLLSYQYQNSNPQVNHFPSANHSFVAPPNSIFNKSNNQSNPIGSNIINNKMNSIPQPNNNFINPMGWSTNDYLINKANNITHTPSPPLSASLVSQANNASMSSSSSTLQSNSSASSTPSPHLINPQFQMNAYNNNYNYFVNQPVGSNMKQNQFRMNTSNVTTTFPNQYQQQPIGTGSNEDFEKQCSYLIRECAENRSDLNDRVLKALLKTKILLHEL